MTHPSDLLSVALQGLIFISWLKYFSNKRFPLLQSQHTIVIVIVTVTDDGRGSRPSVAGDMVFRSAVTEQMQHLQCLATNIFVSKMI